MLLKVTGHERRVIPWELKDKRTKEITVMINEIPGGHVIAIPLIYFSTIVLEHEHKIVARSRIERPLRASMQLPEAKKVAGFIVDNLK